MSCAIFGKTFTLVKSCTSVKPGGIWMAPFAMALFIGSYIWRNYYSGQQDSVFFQILSLFAIWYVYLFGVAKTIFYLRANSNSFLINDVKEISYWIGLCSSLIIHCTTFLMLNQIGFSGILAFLIAFQPGIILLLGRWNKWMDIARLNISGLIPFLFINGYLMVLRITPLSAVWSWLIGIFSSVFVIAVFYSQYKRWMNNPRNSTILDVDYREVKKHYTSNRGFD